KPCYILGSIRGQEENCPGRRIIGGYPIMSGPSFISSVSIIILHMSYLSLPDSIGQSRSWLSMLPGSSGQAG
ncbi:MAG: hypothetical protein KAS19_02615, partial [Anaerolineales bacterium]|nr:hypothetical protein [Anaerolineales bacterium]